MLKRTFFFYLSDKEAQARRRAKPASETNIGRSKLETGEISSWKIDFRFQQLEKHVILTGNDYKGGNEQYLSG